MRSRDLRITVEATRISVAHVVDENDDDVGSGQARYRKKEGQEQQFQRHRCQDMRCKVSRKGGKGRSLEFHCHLFWRKIVDLMEIKTMEGNTLK